MTLYYRNTGDYPNPNANPGVSIAGVPDFVCLGIEAIGATAQCSGGIGTRHLG